MHGGILNQERHALALTTKEQQLDRWEKRLQQLQASIDTQNKALVEREAAVHQRELAQCLTPEEVAKEAIIPWVEKCRVLQYRVESMRREFEQSSKLLKAQCQQYIQDLVSTPEYIEAVARRERLRAGRNS